MVDVTVEVMTVLVVVGIAPLSKYEQALEISPTVHCGV